MIYPVPCCSEGQIDSSYCVIISESDTVALEPSLLTQESGTTKLVTVHNSSKHAQARATAEAYHACIRRGCLEAHDSSSLEARGADIELHDRSNGYLRIVIGKGLAGVRLIHGHKWFLLPLTYRANG